jgi:hypothetical protein
MKVNHLRVHTPTIWHVKHVFIWGIVYKQGVANVKGYIKKKTSKFLWKISLLGLSDKKCRFCMQNF